MTATLDTLLIGAASPAGLILSTLVALAAAILARRGVVALIAAASASCASTSCASAAPGDEPAPAKAPIPGARPRRMPARRVATAPPVRTVIAAERRAGAATR